MSSETQDNKQIPKKKKRYKALRIFAKVMLGILIFLFLLVLFIRSEWGQGIIVHKAVKYVSDKTNTEVAIEKLYITFDGDILLKGLYLEDKKGDTLIYAKSLEADIPLWPIIQGSGIGVEAVDIEELRANIIRKDTIEGYNFQFLQDAFASSETTPAPSNENTEPLNIILGNFHLKTIDVVFNDAVLGIESHFVFDELLLEMDETNLETMTFKANDIALKNANIKYYQSPVPIDPNAEPVPMPILAVDNLTLENTYVDYQSYGDRIAATLDIGEASLDMSLANLVETRIDISEFKLKNSSIFINTETVNNAITDKTNEVVEKAKQDIKAFEWPEIAFNIDEIDLENNTIQYSVGDAKPKVGVFNPDAILLNTFNFKGNNIFIKNKEAAANIDEVNFTEFSGFNLKKLGVAINVTDNQLSIKDLGVAVNNNSLNGRVSMEYPSLSQLISAPDKSKIDVKISDFQFDLAEVFKFQPQLKENQYLQILSKKRLFGDVTASGYLSNVSIPNANFNWGKDTKISANGSISNLTDLEKMQFKFPKIKANTSKNDILKFVNEQELGVSLPQDVELIAALNGSPTNMFADATLTTTQGVAKVEGTFRNDGRIAFDGTATIDNYAMGALLQNEQLGDLSLNIKATGEGNTINDLDAKVDATVRSFAYNGYEIKDLKLNGNFKDGTGSITSKYKDTNINADLEAVVVLDSIATQADLKLNLIGADLQALGLMQRDVRTGLILTASFNGNMERYDASALLENGRVVYDNKTYLIGDLNAKARVRKDSTAFSVKNRILDFELESNTDPVTFSNSLQEHIFSYFYRDAVQKDTLKNPVKLKARGTISDAPLLNEVFLVNIQELDTIKIAMDFDENRRKLKAEITAPLISYGGNKVDSLAFKMDTDEDKFAFDFGFKNIEAGPINIQRTVIRGKQINNELDLDFIAFQKDSTLIKIKSEITGNRDRLRFHINPDSLIIQKKPWQHLWATR